MQAVMPDRVRVPVVATSISVRCGRLVDFFRAKRDRDASPVCQKLAQRAEIGCMTLDRQVGIYERPRAKCGHLVHSNRLRAAGDVEAKNVASTSPASPYALVNLKHGQAGIGSLPLQRQKRQEHLSHHAPGTSNPPTANYEDETDRHERSTNSQAAHNLQRPP